MPHISMNPDDHYVTQAASYDRLLVGKVLTNRRITALKKKGWFGSGNLSLERLERTKKKNKRPASAFKELMKGFGQ